MRIKSIACALTLLGIVQVAHGRGVSPYLPLNLAPEVERQIEEVLILAGRARHATAYCSSHGP